MSPVQSVTYVAGLYRGCSGLRPATVRLASCSARGPKPLNRRDVSRCEVLVDK
jgi:hypothetical protein